MKYLTGIILLCIYLSLSYADSAKIDNSTLHTTSGQIDMFYVGADNDCDFSTINGALSAATSSQNPVEVLVADNKNYTETLFISLNNILIDGSYANCTDARNGVHGGNRVKLSGGSSSFSIATINITGVLVSLKSFQLDSNNAYRGIFANETSVITLEDMLFWELSDSAIRIEGDSQIDLKIKKSLFILNTAEQGAAIYCNGSNHSITVTENTSFGYNSTTSSGGAIYINNGCDFSMSDGIFDNNNSGNYGGAIAKFSFTSHLNLNRITFNQNIAGSKGGAISTWSGSLTASALRFIKNEATDEGGAIYNLRTRFILTSSQEDCINAVKCNLFDDNKASTGGAIYSTDAKMDISSAYFENNRADEGTAIFLPEPDGDYPVLVKVEGSIFTHNGNRAAGGYDDIYVIKAADESIINITYSTFADNNALFATFGLDKNPSFSLYTSIINDPSSDDVFDFTNNSSNEPTLDVNCLIVHETESFDANNANIAIADPMFVDPSSSDYHINATTSPAVDYCTDTIAMAQFSDIDFENRGFDDPTVDNNPSTNGRYDIGADETYSNDILFKNGFDG